jgi:hypothetical protein
VVHLPNVVRFATGHRLKEVSVTRWDSDVMQLFIPG